MCDVEGGAEMKRRHHLSVILALIMAFTLTFQVAALGSGEPAGVDEASTSIETDAKGSRAAASDPASIEETTTSTEEVLVPEPPPVAEVASVPPVEEAAIVEEPPAPEAEDQLDEPARARRP